MSDRRLEALFEQFRRHGDAGALGEVFDACAPKLMRIARHVAHDPAEAEDLVQGTFVAAIERRASFDDARNLEPWLTGILLKQASLARRARGRALEPDRLATRAGEDPLDAAGARELSDALAVALARLSPTDRDVLIPLLLDGRRAVEIARELGRRPDTVHMGIHRGLARLRRLLPASFALAVAAGSARARGLGAVRMQVMRAARAELGIASASGASIAVTSWGAAMTLKKVALASAVVVLCLGVGGYRLLTRAGPAGAPRTSDNAVAVQPAQRETGLATPEVARAQPVADVSSRSSVKNPEEPNGLCALELELLREDHHPAAAALVALVDAAGRLASARADARGICNLEVSAGIADVFVRDDGRLPLHARLEIAAGGRRTLELPRGQELSGRLRLANSEALPSLELRLSTDSAPEGFASADVAIFKALDLLEYGNKQLRARIQVGADGAFRFQGLPADWSGALTLPAELVFVIDGKPTPSSQRAFTAAASALELVIAYRPRILGRLVDADTRIPIASAEFACVLEWSDGGEMLTGGRSDALGRFTIALDYRTDAIGLEIDKIRSPGKAAASAKQIPKWNVPCEPHDAGDIACTFPAARALEFHAVDQEGHPLAGARAEIDGLDVETANGAGVGTFAAVPLDAKQLRAVAPGRAIARVELDAQTVTPLVIVLAPTNRLTLALTPELVGHSDLYVQLVSRPLLFGGTSRMYDSRLRGETVGRCWTADGDLGTKEGMVRLAFSEEGRIEVEDVRSDVPFRVQLRGSKAAYVSSDSDLLTEIAIDSLGPTEQRRIDFTQGDLGVGSRHVVRGRVLDDSGKPILGAGISTCFACSMQIALSDFDGNFRFDATDKASIDIEVSKRGFVPFRVRDWDVRSEKAVEARLLRGHDLRVELVDAQDRAVDGAFLRAEMDGFGLAGRIEGGPPGVFTLCDLPDGEVQIAIIVAGANYARSLRSDESVARIVLPEHGRLEVSWHWRESLDAAADYRLALLPIAGDGVPQIGWTPLAARVANYVFPSVLPGEYSLGFEVRTLNATGQDYDYVSLHGPVRVVVAAGKTSQVELRP